MIERIDDPKGHYYRDPDSGMLLPGVTMILDAVAPEPEALTRYGRRLDAEAGIRTGTTIHGDYEEVPAELAAEALGLADARRYQAMAAGTAAHADIAAWLNSNDQRTPLGGPHPDDAPPAAAWPDVVTRVFERLELVSWQAEVAAIRPSRYGGTVDLVGVDRGGRVHVVDWKIRTEADEWLAEAYEREALQVAAYSGLSLVPGTPSVAHVARLGADGSGVLSTIDLDGCWAAWARLEQQWRLTAARERRWHLSRVVRLGGDQ